MNNKLFNQFILKGLPTTEIGQWVFQEKVKMLYRNHTQSWILSILAASLITYLAIESGFAVVGISWWAAFFVVSMLRTWNTVKFCRISEDQPITDYCPWFRWFYFYTFLAGMGWCVGGILIGSYLDQLYQVYVLIVLIGVGAAAIPLLGVVIVLCLHFRCRRLFLILFTWLFYLKIAVFF